MPYADTDITLERSGADHTIWCGVLPGQEIMQIIDCAAKIRLCKQTTILYAINAGWDIEFDMTRVQWRKTADHEYELWAWQDA